MVQRCLTTIAVLPALDPKELSKILGVKDGADKAVATGLAYRADGRIEVHPLARNFLVMKLREQSEALDIARMGFEIALARALYDDAFGLIKEFELDECLEGLILASYSNLIESGRIATLEEYGRHGATHGQVSQAVLDVISSESALLTGRFDRAQRLGDSAGKALGPGHCLKARAYLTAGRAALLASRGNEAFAFHAAAAKYSTARPEMNDAIWGKFLALVSVEDERALASAMELEAIANPRATDRVRMALARVNLALVDDTNGLAREDDEDPTSLSEITDPWVRSGWTQLYGYSLVVRARYAEARKVLRAGLGELDEFGLSFGMSHFEHAAAAAELGLRHFARCDAVLRRIERRQNYNHDLYVELNVRALWARLRLAQQRPLEAIEITAEDFDVYPRPSIYGEYLATRALALAVVGDKRGATTTADRAAELTKGLETRVLCAAVRALVPEGVATDLEAAEALLKIAYRLNAWDSVICAVRASPELLSRLAKSPRHRAELRGALLRSNDMALARKAGIVTRSTGSYGVLSPREREILDHVSQGRTNFEIAGSLFISPGTVKSHMDHVFDKLGVRSRAAAVARYAEIEIEETDEAEEP
jgi:DNA-binding CsgD family transcriptional regulator